MGLPCNRCNGLGEVMEQWCDSCHGDGVLRYEAKSPEKCINHNFAEIRSV